jgi:nucleoside-diphosphate-sugar epimerase
MDQRPLKVTGDVGQVIPLPFALTSEDSVRRVLSRSNVVVNCLGAKIETLNYSFHDAHVKSAYRIVKLAKQSGIARFVHISTLNPDINSPSKWIATKTESEQVVRAFFPDATILRVAPIFGPTDKFVNTLADFATLVDRIPIFGGGKALIQPVHVADVSNAVLAALATTDSVGKTYHLGGRTVYTMNAFVDKIFEHMLLDSNRRELGPTATKALGRMYDLLPPRWRRMGSDTLARFQADCVVPATDPSGEPVLTFSDLGVTPQDSERMLAFELIRHRGNREVHRFGEIPDELPEYQ